MLLATSAASLFLLSFVLLARTLVARILWSRFARLHSFGIKRRDVCLVCNKLVGLRETFSFVASAVHSEYTNKVAERRSSAALAIGRLPSHRRKPLFLPFAFSIFADASSFSLQPEFSQKFLFASCSLLLNYISELPYNSYRRPNLYVSFLQNLARLRFTNQSAAGCVAEFEMFPSID